MSGEATFSYEELKERQKFTAVIVDSRKALAQFEGQDPKEQWRFALYNRVTDKFIPVQMTITDNVRGTMPKVLGAFHTLGITAPKGASAEWFNGWEIQVQATLESFGSNSYIVYLPTAKVGKVSESEYVDLAVRLEARRAEAKASRGGTTAPGGTLDLQSLIPTLKAIYGGQTEEGALARARAMPAGDLPINVLAAIANGDVAVALLDQGVLTLGDDDRFEVA